MPHHVRTCSRSILRISIVKADPKREQLLSLDWQHLAALENSVVRAPFQLLNLILHGETLRVANLGLQHLPDEVARLPDFRKSQRTVDLPAFLFRHANIQSLQCSDYYK